MRERLHDGEVLRNLDLAMWGLRPSWAKEGGPAPINARIETAATNGMFRSAFADARRSTTAAALCIVVRGRPRPEEAVVPAGTTGTEGKALGRHFVQFGWVGQRLT